MLAKHLAHVVAHADAGIRGNTRHWSFNIHPGGGSGRPECISPPPFPHNLLLLTTDFSRSKFTLIRSALTIHAVRISMGKIHVVRRCICGGKQNMCGRTVNFGGSCSRNTPPSRNTLASRRWRQLTGLVGAVCGPFRGHLLAMFGQVVDTEHAVNLLGQRLSLKWMGGHFGAPPCPVLIRRPWGPSSTPLFPSFATERFNSCCWPQKVLCTAFQNCCPAV